MFIKLTSSTTQQPHYINSKYISSLSPPEREHMRTLPSIGCLVGCEGHFAAVNESMEQILAQLPEGE